MINELWNTIDNMDTIALKSNISFLEDKNSSQLSLEEKIKLYFCYIKINCLDKAMYQIQSISDEIKLNGIDATFSQNFPDLKINLMSGGNSYCIIREADCCDEIGLCCGEKWCCSLFGCFGVLFCITMCCGQEGLDCVLSPLDPETGKCCICNDESYCCNNCISDFCCACFEDQCCDIPDN